MLLGTHVIIILEQLTEGCHIHLASLDCQEDATACIGQKSWADFLTLHKCEAQLGCGRSFKV